MVPESIHTTPTEGHWKFLGWEGRGVLKAKILEEKHEAKLELNFLGGGVVRGCKTKTPFMGGVWIFSGTTQQKWIIICNNGDYRKVLHTFLAAVKATPENA